MTSNSKIFQTQFSFRELFRVGKKFFKNFQTSVATLRLIFMMFKLVHG